MSDMRIIGALLSIALCGAGWATSAISGWSIWICLVPMFFTVVLTLLIWLFASDVQ